MAEVAPGRNAQVVEALDGPGAQVPGQADVGLVLPDHDTFPGQRACLAQVVAVGEFEGLVVAPARDRELGAFGQVLAQRQQQLHQNADAGVAVAVQACQEEPVRS